MPGDNVPAPSSEMIVNTSNHSLIFPIHTMTTFSMQRGARFRD